MAFISVPCARLRELFDYSPDTGILTWRSRPLSEFKDERAWKIWHTRYAGARAGCVNPGGYLQANVLGKMTLVHRIAWTMHYGEPPQMQIDHINHDKQDNRIANLRQVTASENRRNLPVRARNRWGIHGVAWLDEYQCWYPSVCIRGKTINLSYTKDFFEACCARKSAELKYGFHPNHGQQAA